MKKRKLRTVYQGVSRWMTVPVLTLWLLAMLLLTWAVARDFYRQLESRAQDWANTAKKVSGEADALPGALEYEMLENLGMGYPLLRTEPLLPIVLPQQPGSIGTDSWYWEKWDLVCGYQAALAYYDDRGDRLVASGDYLYFPYRTAPEGETVGYAYVDLSQLRGGKALADRYIRSWPGGDRPFWEQEYLCLTGHFEGNRFLPVRITYGDTVCYETDTGDAAVTVYATDVRGYRYAPGGAFLLGGKRYDSPLQLLEAQPETGFRLLSAVICSRRETDSGSVVLAVWCSPLLYGLLRLLPVYLVSLGLVVWWLVFLRKRLRRTVTEPLAVINRAYEANRVQLSEYAGSPWQELQTLCAHFDAAQDARHQASQKVKQLTVALEYARNAEESRRKMVSAIAHELKTPLAVIHSYAEGLQTGIAEEKREKYLSVIQEETERMDALVLEMLELSRLEAGKVRLRTDQFSLEEMTNNIFEKLSLAVQAKQLRIALQFAGESVITADEARMAQVITNFADNAVKYTTPGGNIRVQSFRRDGMVCFRIANDCPNLTQEELQQIWDAFYRTDTARTSGGTGLGLAIAKTIIALHGGSCTVENTATGVVFQFQIPQ